RGVELGHAFVSGVGVVDVVVGELLALQLPRAGDAGALIARAVERRRLMRVLAIAQRFGQMSAEGAIVRRRIGQLLREPVGGCGGWRAIRRARSDAASSPGRPSFRGSR